MTMTKWDYSVRTSHCGASASKSRERSGQLKYLVGIPQYLGLAEYDVTEELKVMGGGNEMRG